MILDTVLQLFAIIGNVLAQTWWLWAFFILFPIFESTWIHWRNELFKRGDDFRCVVLEIRVPREVKKSPKAMEQVLTALHTLRNAPGDPREYWWDGEITNWFALEMVSFGGEIHFYIRLHYKRRPLVEAAFYSYYQDVELVEVDDYVERFPSNIQEMYKQGYDIWGTEMLLVKDAAYPIRSYLDFESPDEDKQYDPISAFLEVLAKVKKEEIVAIQLLIQAMAPDWNKKYEGILAKLHTPRESKKSRSGPKTSMGFEGGILPTFEVMKPGEDKDPAFFKSFMRSPGETNVLEKVEENLAKPAFETIIRFMYLSPKELFYDSFARRGIAGAFNQYGTLDLNSFRQNYVVGTRTRFWHFPYLLPNYRNEYKKERLLWNYRKREMPPQTFMGHLLTSYFFNWNFASQKFPLSTQSIATLFHPPTIMVLTGPHMKRVESRRVGPPAGLPIFGEEKEIEKFQ